MATLAQRLQAEIDRANGTTSKTDTTVHNAISSLIGGYGQVGGIEPIKETYNIVNSQVQAYLDWVEQNPYSASDYTTSYFDDHTYEVNDDPVGVELTLPAGNLIVTDEGNNYTYAKPVSAGAQTIYNLIPYRAKICVEKDGEIASIGELTPTGARRFIKGSGVNNWDLNMRDLGGLTCDGGTIKYGKIIRGGAIYTGDPETLRILHDEVGVRAELDLLGGHLGNNTSPIGNDVDFCCPTSDGTEWIYYDISKTTSMRQAFRFIFDSVKRNRMLYYHCQQGADRTGTLSVLIEGLLGVPQNQVDVDYELTSFSSDGNGLRKRNGTVYKQFITETINNLPGSTFRDKIVNYIASLGFTADEINDFRAAMSTGTPETVTPSIATYTVTKTETNTAITGESSATQYQGYEAEITPSVGYVINDITVTMGGVDITSQVLSAEKTNRYLSITKTLSNCSIDNRKNRVIEGQGYGATITADDGYTLDGGTITITIGGVDMSTYYSNGKIAIPNVTGNIVITATAVPSAPAYTNLADPLSSEWKDGYRIASTGIAAQSGKTVSNPIDVVVGDVVRVKGVSFVSEDRYQCEGKNSGGTVVTQRQYISNLPDTVFNYEVVNDVHIFTLLSTSNIASEGKFCVAFNTPTDASAVIITRNEEIS